MRWAHVIRDAIGIAVLVAVGGIAVSFAFGGGQGGVPMPTVAATAFVLTLVGFVVAGARNPALRGRHLFTIAALVWVLGLVNVLFLGITLYQWLVSALAIFVACLLGGGISALLFRPHAD
jgi:hypothetical protein